MKAGKPIKPRVVWMAAYPDGTLAVHIYGSNERVIRRALSDNAKGWRELAAVGWRAVRVKIAPVR